MWGSLRVNILGPLLFLIYINDLPNCLKKTTPCLYADDTQIFPTSNDSVELANDLNADLENVTDWLNVNKLQSHPSKTKLMVIGSKQNLINKIGDLHTSIVMNNNLVSPVVSNKCLGVDLDHKLTFHTYIEEICKKICSGIGVLRRIRQFIPQGSLVTLYESLIQPYFDYCSPFWDTCDKTLRNKLQIIQNRAARVIIGTTILDKIVWQNVFCFPISNHMRTCLLYINFRHALPSPYINVAIFDKILACVAGGIRGHKGGSLKYRLPKN